MRKLAVFALAIAVVGLPINQLFSYTLLVIAAVIIAIGQVTSPARSWLAAILVAVVVIAGQVFVAPPRIEEGHNVFLPGGENNALVAGLPLEAYRLMAEKFDTAYPEQHRCDASLPSCWYRQGRPNRVYAFSADGIFDRPAYSRRVTDIAFADATWHRLGFVNEVGYNWYDISDLQRFTRLRGLDVFRHPWQRMFHPWQLTMPWFAMYQFPVGFVDSRLCWTGDVLWEGPPENFTPLRHTKKECRIIAAADIGQRIFGVAIDRDAPLSMNLQPTAMIRLRQLAAPALALIGVFAILALLVRRQEPWPMAPFALIGAALLIILPIDASFIGGWRPHDGGDDGLFYEGIGRKIAQYLLAGDFANMLRGGEGVFYYGGPGLRYLRALERFAFGDTNLGYLSLMLAFPALVFGVFRRFLPLNWALAMIIIFVVTPIGGLFGTGYFLYVKWATRGFADPAAAAFFLAGMLVLIGRSARGPDARFAPALGAGFLFFLAVFVRPNLAPMAGVILGGAGVAALWLAQYRRLAGMCLGFLPVLSMALHNWYFGGVFVLFSSNATLAEGLPMTPSAYVAALGEVLRLDFTGENFANGLLQLAQWLAGQSESFLMVPVHAVAVAIVVCIALWGRGYDLWLRLIALAALAGHPVAFFYRPFPRYYYVTWFLTLVVCAVWMRNEGIPLLRGWFPRSADWIAKHPLTALLTRGLDWCVRVSGIKPSVVDQKSQLSRL
jgi:hypothetical protein